MSGKYIQSNYLSEQFGERQDSNEVIFEERSQLELESSVAES
jgi:hypothetical protein